MFQTSPETGALAEALAKAQGSIEVAIKDKTNPHFGSKYADLEAIWSACRATLSAAGVAVTQWPLHSEDGRLHLLTRLALKDQWMQAEFSIPVGKQDAQGFVSALTYAKRCALAAAVGVVASDEDDDGNAAAETKQSRQRPIRQEVSRRSETPQPTPQARPRPSNRITEVAVARLRAALKEHNQDESVFAAYLHEQYGYKAWTHIETNRYDAIMAIAESGDYNVGMVPGPR